MTRIRTAIIDYKMGNIWSLTNALDYLKKDYQLISEPDKLRNFTHILLPGVGSAREAYERLSSSGFAEKIKECVLKDGIMLFGICVGMQLLGSSTEEDGGSECLNFFENKVKKLKINQETKLPHVGFNNVKTKENRLFKNLKQKDFYFVHSYAMEVKNMDYEIGITDYQQNFVSVVAKDNIFGTQFHPEISQRNGLILLNNFFKQC